MMTSSIVYSKGILNVFFLSSTQYARSSGETILSLGYLQSIKICDVEKTVLFFHEQLIHKLIQAGRSVDQSSGQPISIVPCRNRGLTMRADENFVLNIYKKKSFYSPIQSGETHPEVQFASLKSALGA